MAASAGGGVVILWMAAPVSAPTTAGILENLARAKRWLAYLRATRPDDTIIAPWVTWLLQHPRLRRSARRAAR